MKLKNLALFGLISAALCGACGGGGAPVDGRPVSLTPAAITGAADVNTRLVAQALWDAQHWLGQSLTLADLRAVLARSDDAAEPVAAGTNFYVSSHTDDEEFQATLDDIVAFLDERVFVHDAVESQTDTQVVYRVSAERFCSSTSNEDVENAEHHDGTCAEVLSAVEFRLAVTSYAEGDLDIAILVGPDRRETVVIELHRTLAAVTVRVGPALAAVLEVDAAMNADDPEYVAPALSGSGSLRVAIRRLTETRTRVALELPDALDVHGQLGPDEPVYGFAAGPGSSSIDVDRVAHTGQLDVDLRDFVVSGPKDALPNLDGSTASTCFAMGPDAPDCFAEEEPAPIVGTFNLSVARLAGLVNLTDELQELTILGLLGGPVALHLDDQRVFGIDVDGGQTPVDLAITATEDRVDFALSHATTLSTSFRMEDAADRWPDLADSFLAHDDLSAIFDGETPWFSVRDNGFVVESGSIALTSSARPELDRTLEATVCAWFADQGGWDEGSTGSASTSSDGGDSAPAPPVDESDGGEDEAQHLFDFETAPECPDEDVPPPATSASGAS